ncbi:protein kinase C-binding protein 1-like [Contarinia nasturtii]|uniref:protein kinase C-binding protein 1-like n=1 Tax=Contarinia nasturtii TaxID=265458 RepID=UPI0012D3A86D|nr:protein kinase C-binding protein 1-like [Contarinia nasturtii]
MSTAVTVVKDVEDVNNREKPSVADSTQNIELRLLNHTMDEIMNAKTYKKLWKKLLDDDDNVETDGLKGIQSKVQKYQYNDLEEFMDDIKQLSRCYNAHYPKTITIQNAVEALLDWCKRDVNSIQTCPDCFENYFVDEKNYFTMVCTKPHLLVFAQLENYPAWPAKVMKVEENVVNVEFFGDHTEDDVPFEKCYLYTYAMAHQKTRKLNLKIALNELDVHVENVKARYGSFVPFPSKVPISADNWQAQLKLMMPGAFDGSQENFQIEISSSDDESVNSAEEALNLTVDANSTTDMSKQESTSMDQSRNEAKRKKQPNDDDSDSSSVYSESEEVFSPNKKHRRSSVVYEGDTENNGQLEDDETQDIVFDEEENGLNGSNVSENEMQEKTMDADNEQEAASQKDETQVNENVVEDKEQEGDGQDTEMPQDKAQNSESQDDENETEPNLVQANVQDKVPDDNEQQVQSQTGDGHDMQMTQDKVPEEGEPNVDPQEDNDVEISQVNRDKQIESQPTNGMQQQEGSQDEDDNERRDVQELTTNTENNTADTNGSGNDSGNILHAEAGDAPFTSRALIGTMKARLEIMNEDKLDALIRLKDLKETKAKLKNDIAELDDKIQNMKYQIFVTEHEVMCTECGTSLRGEKYFCSTSCENVYIENARLKSRQD